MASALETNEDIEDILICTICLDLFKVPRYLPCLHTFCESCLGEYIVSTNPQEKTQRGFCCPVCRKFVSTDGMVGKSHNFAVQFPKNHLINTMIDKRSIRKSEKHCNACELNNVLEKAVSWCTVCQEALCPRCEICHRKFQISASHKIVSLEEMQSDNTTDISGSVRCEDHQDKFVEIFCVGHSKPCCTVCATVQHRKCENVIAIEQAFCGIKESKQTTDLVGQLVHLKRALIKSKQLAEENVSSVEREAGDVQKEIEEMTENLIKHITKLSQNAKNDLATKKKGMLSHLLDRVTELSSLIAMVDNWQKILATCISYGSELQCFIEVNKLLPRKEQIQSEMIETTSTVEKEFVSFRPNDAMKKFQNSTHSLGSVTKQLVNMHTGKAEVIFSVDAGENCGKSVSGIFVGKFIFLINQHSCNMFKFNDEGQLQKEIKLPDSPFDLSDICNRTVAVSSHRGKEIFLINIEDMNIETTIQTTVFPLGGIKYIEDNFLVAWNKGLTWINSSNGEISQNRKTRGDTYFMYAYERDDYICVDVSNTVSRKVDGETKFIYTNEDLSSPRGIDVDFQGNIYICGRLSNNIHQLSSAGKLVRIIRSADVEVEKPWVIRFKLNSNRFLLSTVKSGRVVICQIR